MNSSDVIIVGGGIAGSVSAYFLAREGFRVRLLERGELAAEASGAAAGMLLPIGEARGRSALYRFGMRSLAEFPELCDELIERTGFDPEYEASGALHVATTETRLRELQTARVALPEAKLEVLGADETRAEASLGPDVCGSLWSPGEAHVRSPLFAKALAAGAAQLGVRIETGTLVTGFVRRGDRVVGVRTPDHVFAADHVVLCSGAWAPSMLDEVGGGFRLPVEPVRGQIVALERPESASRAIIFAENVYLVAKRDGTLVAGATQEHVGFDRRVTAEGVLTVLRAATRLAPALATASFRGAWAGLRPTTPDGLPLIGPHPNLENLILATGHSRSGVLLAPVTGRWVADLVAEKSLVPEELSPSRFAPA